MSYAALSRWLSVCSTEYWQLTGSQPMHARLDVWFMLAYKQPVPRVRVPRTSVCGWTRAVFDHCYSLIGPHGEGLDLGHWQSDLILTRTGG